MPVGDFNPAQKPSFGRFKPTARQREDISTKARKAARKRAGGRCEACGWHEGTYDHTGRKWGLQCAHLIRRGKVEGGTTETEVACLCGPSVNTGTCHNIIDYTKAGKDWAIQYREYLLGNRADKPKLHD